MNHDEEKHHNSQTVKKVSFYISLFIENEIFKQSELLISPALNQSLKHKKYIESKINIVVIYYEIPESFFPMFWRPFLLSSIFNH